MRNDLLSLRLWRTLGSRRKVVGLLRPVSLNALISYLFSSLFDDDGEGTRFVSGASVSKIILKLEESAKVVIFTVRKKDCWVRLEGSRQGVKGALTIAEEMFELTPSLVVVENLTADDVKEPVAVSAVDVIVSSLDMLER
ncbi:hypothetical protein Bca4012_049717 [Brassica carinata]